MDLDLLVTLGDYGLHAKDISYCVKRALNIRSPEAVYWFLEHSADPNAVHHRPTRPRCIWHAQAVTATFPDGVNSSLLIDASQHLRALG